MNSPGTCSCMKPRESPWPLSSSTSRAPGCQVRTRILSPCWWGPRNAKGSPCSARISACTWAASIRSSTALPLSIVILHEGFAQLYQPCQGHIQPLWPVAGFVRNLVGGLLDTEQRQRCLFSIVLLPDMVQTGCGLPVGFEKRLHRLFPVSDKCTQQQETEGERQGENALFHWATNLAPGNITAVSDGSGQPPFIGESNRYLAKR